MRRIKSWSFDLGKIIAGILLIVGWSKGAITGYTAWVLLFMLISFKLEINR